MTEKRFINEDDCWGYYTEIIDNEKELDLSLPNPKKNLTIKELVDLLNELYEESQDFKAFNQELAENLSACANARISKDNRIERLEEKIQRERTSFTKTHKRWSKEAENKIKKLSEENEELKRELQTYRKVAGCFNCHYHNYDWYDDGDEFEVCDIGNDVTEGICEKWEELS